MQKGMSSTSDNGRFRKINPNVEKTISTMKDKTSGIIPALEILQVGYNEMKEHLDRTSTLSATTITTDILKGLETIEKIFNNEIIEEQPVNYSDDVSSAEDNVNTNRRKIKKKAFRGDGASSSKKEINMKYRTSIIDDGEFLNISKSSQHKSKKINKISARQAKTVNKQLEDRPM